MERRRLARLRGAVEPSDGSAPPQPNDRQLRPTAQPRRHHTGPRPAADVERTELRLVPSGDKSPAARWQHGCETGGRNLPAMCVAGQAQIEAPSRCGRVDKCGAVSQQQFDGRVATWLQRPRAPARRVVGRVDGHAAVAGLPGPPRVDDHQQLSMREGEMIWIISNGQPTASDSARAGNRYIQMTSSCGGFAPR